MGCSISTSINKDTIEKNIDCSAENVLIPIQVKNDIRYFKFPLSKREIEALKNSWDTVKTKWVELSAVAFRRWFTTHPAIRKLFKNFSANSSFDELFVSKELIVHVRKIEAAVEAVVSKVDKIEELILLLIGLGRSHHAFGVTQMHANALAASFQFGICEVFRDIDLITESAWDSLLRFIIDIFKYGIRLEESALKSKTITCDSC